jgi:hypothetical protein
VVIRRQTTTEPLKGSALFAMQSPNDEHHPPFSFPRPQVADSETGQERESYTLLLTKGSCHIGKCPDMPVETSIRVRWL